MILEVGPGLGSLTLALLEAAVAGEDVGASRGSGSGRVSGASEGPGATGFLGATGVLRATGFRGGGGSARIVAVEIDPVLAAELPKTIADRAPAVRRPGDVVLADALRWAGPRTAIRRGHSGRVAEVLPGRPPTVLAANLPYNVAVPVVLHLLASFPSIRRGVVMVQAEVADRMCAGPAAGYTASRRRSWPGTRSARLAGTVPRSVFWPVPNVDSKLVAFTAHEAPEAAGAVSREEVFAVIDAAFGQRRKTLRAALATWAGSPAQAEAVVRAAGVDPGARGESLGIAEFARIAATARTVALPRSSGVYDRR